MNEGDLRRALDGAIATFLAEDAKILTRDVNERTLTAHTSPRSLLGEGRHLHWLARRLRVQPRRDRIEAASGASADHER